MLASKNQRLAAILFADMNERFPTEGMDESPVDEQTKFVILYGWKGKRENRETGGLLML